MILCAVSRQLTVYCLQKQERGERPKGGTNRQSKQSKAERGRNETQKNTMKSKKIMKMLDYNGMRDLSYFFFSGLLFSPSELPNKARGATGQMWCSTVTDDAVHGAEQICVISVGRLMALSMVLKTAALHSGKDESQQGHSGPRFCPLSLSFIWLLSLLLLCHSSAAAFYPSQSFILHFCDLL